MVRFFCFFAAAVGFVVAPPRPRVRLQAESSTMERALESLARARMAVETARIAIETRIARDTALLQTFVSYARQKAVVDTALLVETSAEVASSNLTLREAWTIVSNGAVRVPLLPPGSDEALKARRRQKVLNLVTAGDAIADMAYEAKRDTQLPAGTRAKPLMLAAAKESLRLERQVAGLLAPGAVQALPPAVVQARQKLAAPLVDDTDVVVDAESETVDEVTLDGLVFRFLDLAFLLAERLSVLLLPGIIRAAVVAFKRTRDVVARDDDTKLLAAFADQFTPLALRDDQKDDLVADLFVAPALPAVDDNKASEAIDVDVLEDVLDAGIVLDVQAS